MTTPSIPKRLKVPETAAELELLLRRRVANLVFWLLICETAALFALLFFHGFKYQGFSISDATLQIFLPVTIAQISSMAIIITKYLFSK